MGNDNRRVHERYSLLDLFRSEIDYQTEILRAGLLALERMPDHREAAEQLSRAAHAINGAARAVHCTPVVQLAHAMEHCFLAVKQGTLPLTDKSIGSAWAGVGAICRIAASNDHDAWLQENQIEFAEIVFDIGRNIGEKEAGEPKKSSP